MARPAAAPPEQRIPFWRDGRVLGVFAQIGFIIVMFFAVRTVATNFASNVDKLGESQFICRDGSFSYRCAYDFMDSEAGFDIADTILNYVNTDSYWRAFGHGVLNSLKVGLMGVILTSFLGLFVGIARLSNNWLVSKISLAYIELIRNTPLLLQLFFIYFGFFLALPLVKEAEPLFGLPIYLTNRGMSVPAPQLMSSAAIWLAFIILGVIQFQVVWIFLARKEEKTGHSSNRWGWGIASFLIIVAMGWFVAGAVSNNEGALTPKASRIRQIDDLQKLMLQRAGVNYLEELDAFEPEEIDALAVQVCVLRDSASEPNIISQLSGLGIPFEMNRFDRADQATAAYIEGECELFVASNSVLAAERSLLENSSAHILVPISEKPIVWDVPRVEGTNLSGGSKLFPEFAALLIGLTLFYGASLAEIVRAGIMSVSKGQSEAAKALGLNESQRLRLVVLPQALKVIIPPLIGIYLSLMKDTSLGIAIAFPDMYMVSYTITNQSGRAVQGIVLLMSVYLVISLIFSVLLNWYNSRNTMVER